MPRRTTLDLDEVMLQFIDSDKLREAGLRLVDVPLLAAAILSRAPLWTADEHLEAASAIMALGYRR